MIPKGVQKVFILKSNPLLREISARDFLWGARPVDAQLKSFVRGGKRAHNSVEYFARLDLNITDEQKVCLR